MEELEILVGALCNAPDKEAYRALKELREKSRQSSAVYPYMDVFLGLLGEANSYLRTRGLVLAAANARWDEQKKLDAALGEYLAHIEDEKPITARQCVQALPEIAAAKPALIPQMRRALLNANTARYPESMASLLERDIAAALKALAKAEADCGPGAR